MKFEMIPYHESAALSASKAYNAMSWPGGAAIFPLYIYFTIDFNVSLVCAL